MIRLAGAVLLFSVLVVACASPARSETGDVWVGAQLGVTAPTGDFGKVIANGPAMALSIRQFERHDLGLGLELAYHAWGSFDLGYPLVPWPTRPTSSITLDALQVTGQLLYDIRTGTPIRPYLSAGYGLYVMRASLRSVYGHASATEWTPGLVVGGGATVRLAPTVALGLSGQYHALRPVGNTNELADFVTVGVSLFAVQSAEHARTPHSITPRDEPPPSHAR